VKKPNHSSIKPKRHSDSDDNDDSDELRIIKSVPGTTKAVKGASGGTSRAPGLIFFITSSIYILYLVRELRFTVEYKDHTERITIFDNETIRM